MRECGGALELRLGVPERQAIEALGLRDGGRELLREQYQRGHVEPDCCRAAATRDDRVRTRAAACLCRGRGGLERGHRGRVGARGGAHAQRARADLTR